MATNSPCAKLWEKIEKYHISVAWLPSLECFEARGQGEEFNSIFPRKAVLELLKKIEGKKR